MFVEQPLAYFENNVGGTLAGPALARVSHLGRSACVVARGS